MSTRPPRALAVALGGWLAMGACAAAAPQPPPAPVAPVAPMAAQTDAETIATLHLGESVTPPTSTVAVTFTDVSDSRCPTNVTCVWAGDAAVTLRVQPAKGAAHVVVLHTGVADGQSATAAGLRLRIERLEPNPTFGKATERSAYVATIALASSAGPR